MSEGFQTPKENRFYLRNIGDPDDAYTICGECLLEWDVEYDEFAELDPLPDEALKNGHTRGCIGCTKNEGDLTFIEVPEERDSA